MQRRLEQVPRREGEVSSCAREAPSAAAECVRKEELARTARRALYPEAPGASMPLQPGGWRSAEPPPVRILVTAPRTFEQSLPYPLVLAFQDKILVPGQ